MDLTIIIVNYNVKNLLYQALKSIPRGISHISYEVQVVDNHSTDGSQEMVLRDFPEVDLIQNKENVGYAKANNQAIRKAKGKYILLLNPDTVILPGAIDKLMDYLSKHKQVGAIGPKIEMADGNLDKACKRGFPTPLNSLFKTVGLDKLFPNSRLFGSYNLTYLNNDMEHLIDCLVGACMLVRREVIEKVGMLDEQFFMYGEDIDWCYRIKDAGWYIVYYPEAKIIHYKRASSSKRKLKTTYEFHRAMVLYFKKHYSERYNVLIMWLVYLGIGASYLVSLLKLLVLGFKGGGPSDTGVSEDT
ncbi:glycosyltransferase family 2 protein [Metallumcola ferriviriculae]|uniref:Glycosyltransferase family 2 protein n=1 Tax=Metallumcola ferriviriculae TaxID=3039180 RepID=A0AAU0UKT4_9FIRM|nr:glycosyltransferase family 2 protein [Desulfitibacteraceae bacterium MK1]